MQTTRPLSIACNALTGSTVVDTAYCRTDVSTSSRLGVFDKLETLAALTSTTLADLTALTPALEELKESLDELECSEEGKYESLLQKFSKFYETFLLANLNLLSTRIALKDVRLSMNN